MSRGTDLLALAEQGDELVLDGLEGCGVEEERLLDAHELARLDEHLEELVLLVAGDPGAAERLLGAGRRRPRRRGTPPRRGRRSAAARGTGAPRATARRTLSRSALDHALGLERAQQSGRRRARRPRRRGRAAPRATCPGGAGSRGGMPSSAAAASAAQAVEALGVHEPVAIDGDHAARRLQRARAARAGARARTARVRTARPAARRPRPRGARAPRRTASGRALLQQRRDARRAPAPCA